MSSVHPAVHLVRHGEVWNPHHVVYSDLPGFGLSALGHHQARAAAAYLAPRPVTRVVASPLQRAIETAIPIAAAHGVRVIVEPELTEWRLSRAWVGIGWEDLPTERPGELEAYLADPSSLDFGAETLAEAGQRVAEAVRRQAADADGDTVFVSHQDPIQAGRRSLLGRTLEDFFEQVPTHASVITLDPATNPWTGLAMWTPSETSPIGERMSATPLS